MEEWYALCHLGAEEALRRELASLGAEAEPTVGGCRFSADRREAARILYRTQVATRLLLAIDEAESVEGLEPARAAEHIPEDATFKVECETLPGGPDGSSTDIAAALGAEIPGSVDLDAPDVVVFCQAGKRCLLGIDVAGDLSKRYYRVFTNRMSIKGTFAASLLWLWPLEGSVLDPFANTGEIAVEEALRRTRTSPLRFQKHQRIRVLDEERKGWKDEERDPEHPIWCFDPQLGNLRSCKKNAKLARVDKAITFSKLDREWLDVKFEEGDVAAIVTVPTPVTNRDPDDTQIRELCYQAEFILSKGGTLVVGCLTADTADAVRKHAKTYKLRLRDEREVYTGKLPVKVLRYEL